MARITPEEEAAWAFNLGMHREAVSKVAQPVLDQLWKEHEVAQAEQAAAEAQAAVEEVSHLDCRECGEELTPNARFCASCGEPVTTDAEDTACRECGEQLTPNARFCASCGKPAGRTAPRRSVRSPSQSGEEKLQEFTVKYVTFYDGSGHRLGPAECTLTSMRLIIADTRGAIHQILLRDISGVGTPSKLAAPKMLRIKLLAQTYDIDCVSRDQKNDLETWLGLAIRRLLS